MSRTPLILIWDRRGDVFAALRRTGIAHPVWRVSEPPRNGDLDDIDLAVAAVHRPADWQIVASFVRKVPTVIIVGAAERDDAARALEIGAFGYLDVSVSARALRRAVLGALAGEPAYTRAVLGAWIRAKNGTGTRSAAALGLTARQREVVELIATGASDKEIARVLGISTATAQKHVTRLLHRLKVPNRAAAVATILLTTTATS